MIFAPNTKPLWPGMQQFENFDTSALIDLLAAYTLKYTRMIIEKTGSEEEFILCKQTIKEIQAEIETRKAKPPGKSSTSAQSDHITE